MNPYEIGNCLTLNISENINDLDISLALENAHLYQMKSDRAENTLKEMQREISHWRKIAKKLGISNHEMEQKPSLRFGWWRRAKMYLNIEARASLFRNKIN